MDGRVHAAATCVGAASKTMWRTTARACRSTAAIADPSSFATKAYPRYPEVPRVQAAAKGIARMARRESTFSVYGMLIASAIESRLEIQKSSDAKRVDEHEVRRSITIKIGGGERGVLR